VVDLLLLAWLAVFPPRRDGDDPATFRERYDLTAVTADDILLVGDSFVWGAGVRKEEAFGFQLQALYQQEGRPTRVYSLGMPGGNFPDDLEALAQVPPGVKARQVVLAYYMNDMPPPETWCLGQWDRTQYVPLNRLAPGSPSLQLLSDATGKLLYADVDTYHRFVVDWYDPKDPTFRAPWQMVEG